MLEIGAFQAKNTLGTLLDRVESGEEILITRHGRPVARLVPNTATLDRTQAVAAMKRIQERFAQVRASFDWATMKSDRDSGRP